MKTILKIFMILVIMLISCTTTFAALSVEKEGDMETTTFGDTNETQKVETESSNTSSGRKPSGSSSSTTVKADEKEDAFPIFSDVTENDWFYSDVMYICSKGIMNGISKSSFAPNDTATRAMFITLLYRCSKETASEIMPFNDVEKGSWYEKAAIWGFEKGIVNGTGNGKFSPDSILTREQLAVMLYNFKKSSQDKKSADLTMFSDCDEVSPWATEAMMWAVENKIIGGRENSTLAPKESATRAEAAIVMRRLEKI